MKKKKKNTEEEHGKRRKAPLLACFPTRNVIAGADPGYSFGEGEGIKRLSASGAHNERSYRSLVSETHFEPF